MLADITTLDQYLSTYGDMLAAHAQESLAPLHVPSRDKPIDFNLRRTLFPAQAHACSAGVKKLRHDNAVIYSAECGTGKTSIAIATTHELYRNRPYRSLVFCPPQLTAKWEREIRETLWDCDVHQLTSFSDISRLDRHEKPKTAEWWIVKETMAKTGPGWQPSYLLWPKRKGYSAHPKMICPQCPTCGRFIVDGKGTPIPPARLAEIRMSCAGTKEEPGCGSPLWQWEQDTSRDRWPPATFIHKQLRNYFDMLVIDEIHEVNKPDSVRANAMGTLAAACKKFIGLTGTLAGGYAWHLRTMLLRISPTSLTNEGLKWSNVKAFNELYGRLDTIITEEGAPGNNTARRGRGDTKRTTRSKVQPGIMPSLFAKHLIDKCIFLTLDDLSDDLPPMEESIISVDMDADLNRTYSHVEDALKEQLAIMLQNNDKRLLSAMLDCLLTYPDYPFDWSEVGYWDTDPETDEKEFVPVVKPPSMPRIVRSKEKAIIDAVLAEKRAGRQVWIYVTRTDKHNVAAWLQTLLSKRGITCKHLQASVKTDVREEWINETGPNYDVIISHPQLVRTGLDLFCKRGTYNFVTLMFYETGYDIFTLRQAARRSYRLMQTQGCKVMYFFYRGTMQERAMDLMGRKLVASEMIEGKFSEDGLAAMAGDEASMEVALAKSLLQKMQVNAQRTWGKIAIPKTTRTAKRVDSTSGVRSFKSESRPLFLH